MMFIDRLVERLSWLLMGLAGVALTLMMVQMVVDVIMRNLFNRPIEGSLEIVSVYHMVAVVFLPLALVERRHEHISVDLLVSNLSAGVRRVLMVVGYLLAAIFFGILAHQTLIDAIEAYQKGEILMSSILVTIWPAKFMLPAGFGLMCAQCVLHIWKSITDPDFDPTPPSADAAAEARN